MFLGYGSALRIARPPHCPPSAARPLPQSPSASPAIRLAALSLACPTPLALCLTRPLPRSPSASLAMHLARPPPRPLSTLLTVGPAEPRPHSPSLALPRSPFTLLSHRPRFAGPPPCSPTGPPYMPPVSLACAQLALCFAHHRSHEWKSKGAVRKAETAKLD